MREAIQAFLDGEVYGNFQARKNKEQDHIIEDYACKSLLLPPFGSDAEYIKNPVVLRSLNETRKVINAIIRRYGSPANINVEVASDLARTYEERSHISRQQAKNETQSKTDKIIISELLGVAPEDVNGDMLDRYRLGEQQNWRCLYSDNEIDKVRALKKNDHTYEVDHIVPYSLILDNTLENKALVLWDENRKKGQQTPLMYLSGDRSAKFKSAINLMFKDKVISDKKYKIPHAFKFG
jgi:CRISPR-associated endonuclease Csn1